MSPLLEPMTLPVHCGYCDGTVRLQLDALDAWKRVEMTSQAWLCPHCVTINWGEFSGRLTSATKPPSMGMRH